MQISHDLTTMFNLIFKLSFNGLFVFNDFQPSTAVLCWHFITLLCPEENVGICTFLEKLES